MIGAVHPAVYNLFGSSVAGGDIFRGVGVRYSRFFIRRKAAAAIGAIMIVAGDKLPGAQVCDLVKERKLLELGQSVIDALDIGKPEYLVCVFGLPLLGGALSVRSYDLGFGGSTCFA